MTESGHGEQGPLPGPWDPAEQIGDIYEVEVAVEADEGGQVEQAEALADVPRIWVGFWLDYNNGVLHGQWIDAAQDEDEDGLGADIASMLTGSPTTQQTGEPAEDWGIFDFDNFGSLRIGEQETLAWVSAVARGIAEHGPAFAAYADVMQEQEALEGFADDYLGHFDSVEAFAEQFIDDPGYNELLDRILPDNIRPYVRLDTAALARDMQLGGDIHALPADGGGVWIFDAN